MQKEERPWGYFVNFHSELAKKPGWVKILFLKPGEELSHQFHRKRDELWYCIKGKGKVFLWKNPEEYGKVEPEAIEFEEGSSITIPRGIVHTARADEELYILEFGFGECEEEDIVRLSDKYGRE